MKIENLRSETQGNRARVAATVIWEDCDRPSHEIYFETKEEFAESLSCNPHAFLVACAIPAMHYREKRVFIDAEVCPDLRNGLRASLGFMRHWYGDAGGQPFRIESRVMTRTTAERTPERAGFFFSGGIDSFATLRENHLSYPSTHPGYLRDGILIYGLELDEPDKFEHVLRSLTNVAEQANISLVPVYTNLYLVYRNEDAGNGFSFWYYKFMGAALAAVAHALSRRLTVVSIATDLDIPNQKPHGSHPLLDTNYSSYNLRIRHRGVALSRLEKTKLIAGWDVALENLRVCNHFRQYSVDTLNCGKCEKCVRTMLALTAVGVLDKMQTFPATRVSEDLVRQAVRLSPISLPMYGELLGPLAEKGREDLAHAITSLIEEYYHRQKSWGERIKQFDAKYLGGVLRKSKQALRAIGYHIQHRR